MPVQTSSECKQSTHGTTCLNMPSKHQTSISSKTELTSPGKKHNNKFNAFAKLVNISLGNRPVFCPCKMTQHLQHQFNVMCATNDSGEYLNFYLIFIILKVHKYIVDMIEKMVQTANIFSNFFLSE